MAVYTKIARAQLLDFLDDYDIGTLESFKGIDRGVSNTNYHVHTGCGHFILTICEAPRTDPAGLPFYFSYMQHLAACGIPCPDPVPDNDGNLYGALAGKPAAMVTFLSGAHEDEAGLTPAHCHEAGRLTAAMHLAAQDFAMTRPNGMGMAAWKYLAAKTAGRGNEVDAGLDGMIADELAFLEKNWPGEESIPRGAVHADIFPDNVLFDGGAITGVLDFFFSCTDFLMFDLALVVNAWCFDEKYDFVPARFAALMKGYNELRALMDAEKKNLPLLCRGAALRVLATRTHDWLFRNPQASGQPKDPREYIAKLRFHQNEKIGC